MADIDKSSYLDVAPDAQLDEDSGEEEEVAGPIAIAVDMAETDGTADQPPA